MTATEYAMPTAFTKMHACGNDFVVIDDRAGHFFGRESALARRLCHRHLALGADGLLLLRGDRAEGHFEMVFVNADGLIGEMCGNGARCLAAFIRRAGLATEGLTLQTPAGSVAVRFAGAGFHGTNNIVLDLPPAGPIRSDIAIRWQERDWRFDAIDIGVPHAVWFAADRAALEQAPVEALGRHVRHHRIFAPRGCNINFAALEDGRLYLRTYERGVEAETLGCGTGATAAALLAQHRFGLHAPVEVVTSSGESLLIHWEPRSGLLQLAGGAHFVADGSLDASLLTGLGPDA
ncbi:MAG TPA: diaminopimelate epimerase [Burkholderiaceae bacterium]|nr:diaminopimelate epimerase [Burkholderiaceae bacterium]